MNNSLKLKRGAAALALGALATVGLSGCMTSTPVWDQQRGVALATITQMQIINPDAPEGLPTITGTDGKTGVAAMKNFERSLSRPAAGGAQGFSVDFGAGAYGGVGMGNGASR
ncbi:hypothetical protein Tamer19_09690 [Cupriavidus sp. TA19]|uniref:hypothetical protein n=1 Tax=Cupriavidus sp. TA19 TaxID=701108 RepID=UPI0027294E3D|nr:hypothetical protein [Cupriavidus sp. TA19]GLC91561.1 hypothetical protein Tamer19_09690 [Cupriavidus sp. TA19]